MNSIYDCDIIKDSVCYLQKKATVYDFNDSICGQFIGDEAVNPPEYSIWYQAAVVLICIYEKCCCYH